MSSVFILALLAFGQIIAMAVIFGVVQLVRRLILAYRLRVGRGPSYTWLRAWRKAGVHLSH